MYMLSSIIRSHQQRRRSTPSSPVQPAPQRGFRLRNTMTRPQTRRRLPLPSPTIASPTIAPPTPTTLSISPAVNQNSVFSIEFNHLASTPVFSTQLEENTNIYNYMETSNYYSLFHYNDMNIRYYHNEWIQTQESVNIMNSILHFIQDNDTNESSERRNDANTIYFIQENSEKAMYSDTKHIVINDQCPILLTPFEDDSMIYYFKNCCHALDESVFEKFVQTFQKCPLCNNPLI